MSISKYYASMSLPMAHLSGEMAQWAIIAGTHCLMDLMNRVYQVVANSVFINRASSDVNTAEAVSKPVHPREYKALTVVYNIDPEPPSDSYAVFTMPWSSTQTIMKKLKAKREAAYEHRKQQVLQEPRSQEFFKFNPKDPRAKLLYLSAEYNPKALSAQVGALSPEVIKEILQTLDQAFDIKYKVIQSHDEMCREISDAATTTRLTNIVVDAHGSPDSIFLSVNTPIHGLFQTVNRSSVQHLPSCFSGLFRDGRIVLLSCCTGARSQDADPECFSTTSQLNELPSDHQPIAQRIANDAQRQVVAPSITIGTPKVISVSPLMFYYPYSNSDKNAFQVFTPQ